MLTTKEREEIRLLIESEIHTIEEALEHFRDESAPVPPDVAVGRLSRMDSLVNQETLTIAMDEAVRRLERLRDKIERIDDADFGRCAMCGEWISMERLRLAPERGVCVSCLNERKKAQKRA